MKSLFQMQMMYCYGLLIIICIPVSVFSYQQDMELSIQKAINYALQHNPVIQSALAEIERESAQKRQAWAFPKPEIMLHFEGMPDGTYFETWGSRKLFFIQKFEFFAKYFVKSQQHGYLVKKAHQSLLLDKLNLTANVKIAYTEALLWVKKCDIARENLALSNDVLGKIKLRFDVGEEGRKEFLWAKLQKDRAENAVFSANAQRIEAFERLKLLLSGEFVEMDASELQLTDDLIFIPVDASILKINTSILQNHALVNVNRNNVSAVEKSVSLAKISYLPDIMVAYMNENNNNTPGFWGARLSISFPLWFLSDQTGKIAEAKANLKIAQWDEVRETQKLRKELTTAAAALKETEKQVKRFTDEILQEAEQVYNLAELSYREGESSYIDLLFAQQSLIETRTEYLETLAEYNKAAARFERAIGSPVQ